LPKNPNPNLALATGPDTPWNIDVTIVNITMILIFAPVPETQKLTLSNAIVSGNQENTKF
ncbi:Protein Inturned, partial [Manis pentadactyla]